MALGKISGFASLNREKVPEDRQGGAPAQTPTQTRVQPAQSPATLGDLAKARTGLGLATKTLSMLGGTPTFDRGASEGAYQAYRAGERGDLGIGALGSSFDFSGAGMEPYAALLDTDTALGGLSGGVDAAGAGLQGALRGNEARHRGEGAAARGSSVCASESASDAALTGST